MHDPVPEFLIAEMTPVYTGAVIVQVAYVGICTVILFADDVVAEKPM